MDKAHERGQSLALEFRRPKLSEDAPMDNNFFLPTKPTHFDRHRPLEELATPPKVRSGCWTCEFPFKNEADSYYIILSLTKHFDISFVNTFSTIVFMFAEYYRPLCVYRNFIGSYRAAEAGPTNRQFSKFQIIGRP
ncbi:hypothetical protein RvY_08732-2 [Ramazzottius varieornatus]|uniref:Uncharacterized protein n=1 Tax=Ramazzottius varieornatus TaxID=947166 RepID=A0A1D1V6X7_RAMVA|nr:hypothetical protein RvY_08732-2 [Ramazzottius varieornatus]